MKFQKGKESQRIHSCEDYEKYHRHGLSNVSIANSDVFLEAQRTDKIFPARSKLACVLISEQLQRMVTPASVTNIMWHLIRIHRLSLLFLAPVQILKHLGFRDD